VPPSSHIARPLAPPSRRDLLRLWALAIGGLALAKLLSRIEPTGILAANLAGVAAFLFIALPDSLLRARGDEWTRYGVPVYGLRDGRTWRAVGRGALVALLAAAIVFPVFAAGFWMYAEILPHLPPALARAVAPYGGAPRFSLRLPDGLPLLVVVQLLVVSLPEEVFYRGFMQTSWARSAPEKGVTILGARLGAGFVQTQLLFALGHLVVLQPWRLGTFFPGLVFGWLRERTGNVAAPIFFHALSNVFIATLEASFYR
jgi:uncharacterized protein